MDDAGNEEILNRLRTLEEKVDSILRYVGIAPEAPHLSPTDPRGMAEVMRLIRAGHKVRAIQAYRKRTGCRLKEAKATIEAVGR